ncbi:MAG: histidine phosphatase family protein [Xanthobacteraceae bacterium]|nr:MAG: histidine phosphatase family protein [Xanthobacteraceae bacterium]
MGQAVACLLRHGETEGGSGYYGVTDVALSSHGMRQMEAATRDAAWDRIVSSPLRRCRAFADRLSQERGVPLAVDERLSEMNFGAWEGRTAAAIMAEDPEPLTRFWQDPLAHPPPGGERLDHFAARVWEAWRDIRRGDGNLAGQRVLVVTHGGPIRVILCRIQALPLARLMELKVDHASLHRAELGSCSDPT